MDNYRRKIIDLNNKVNYDILGYKFFIPSIRRNKMKFEEKFLIALDNIKDDMVWPSRGNFNYDNLVRCAYCAEDTADFTSCIGYSERSFGIYLLIP